MQTSIHERIRQVVANEWDTLPDKVKMDLEEYWELTDGHRLNAGEKKRLAELSAKYPARLL